MILSNLKYIKYPFTKTENLNLRAMSVIRKEQVNKTSVISQIQRGHREPFIFIKIGIMHANEQLSDHWLFSLQGHEILHIQCAILHHFFTLSIYRCASTPLNHIFMLEIQPCGQLADMSCSNALADLT